LLSESRHFAHAHAMACEIQLTFYVAWDQESDQHLVNVHL